jgi:hypothetical protein
MVFKERDIILQHNEKFQEIKLPIINNMETNHGCRREVLDQPNHTKYQ